MMLALTPRWVLQGVMNSEKRSRKLKDVIRQRLAAMTKLLFIPLLKIMVKKIIMNGSNIFYVMMKPSHPSVHFLES